MRFENRVALITGGGRGIGAATAELFAAEGASVAVCDLDKAPAEEVAFRLPGKSLAVACDVSQRASVESAFDQVMAEFGRIDFLVACAGITRDNLVFKMTDEDWFGVINTHLTGTFLCAQ